MSADSEKPNIIGGNWTKYCTVAKSVGRGMPIWTSVVVRARVVLALCGPYCGRFNQFRSPYSWITMRRALCKRRVFDFVPSYLNYIDLLLYLHAQRHGFRPTEKEPFLRSEFTLVLALDILDDGRSPNAVKVHAGTTQVDFEVDRPPPADSLPGDILITTVKEGNGNFVKKKEFRKMKKAKLFRLSYWSVSDENATDCEIACDCVKRANVVLCM